MVKNYPCPSCGADMTYEEGSDHLHCASCGLEVPVEDYLKAADGKPKVEVKPNVNEGENSTVSSEKVTVRHYHCPNCGADLLTEPETAATFCTYCGSPAILEEQLTGTQKPDLVIPFAFNREKAKEKFREWTKKGLLTPNLFRKSTTLEKVTGLYVPYWLYDYYARTRMTVHATQSSTHREGDYRVTNTRHFLLTRDIGANYEKIPQDASKKMDDNSMRIIEPYNPDTYKEFSLPYLSGFLADSYEYTSEDLRSMAESRALQYNKRLVMDSMSGYSIGGVVSEQSELQKGPARYALLPVYIMTYRYANKNNMLLINGQTGKTCGKIPISFWKAAAAFAGSFGIMFGILTLLGYFI